MSKSASRSSMPSRKSLRKTTDSKTADEVARINTMTENDVTQEETTEMAAIETKLIKLEKMDDPNAKMKQHQIILKQPVELNESTSISLAELS